MQYNINCNIKCYFKLYYTIPECRPTTTNQQLREQTSQPPLTHYIYRAQLKLFGHILRASEQCLERSCCLSKAFVYRRGIAGEDLRRGRPQLPIESLIQRYVAIDVKYR